MTAISAADAGAAIPRATKPTVASKNFFITQSPFVMRFVEATIPFGRSPLEFRGYFRRDSSRGLYHKGNTHAPNERRLS